MNHAPRSSSTRHRAGHTLVEILLALGLSLVILAAAYAALDQHARYATAGQQQTERLQITRALFERLSLDVRSVVFLHAVGRQELQFGRSTGIVGDRQTLSLLINAPSGEQATESQSVRWEMRAIEPNLNRRTAARPATNPASLGLARIVRQPATAGLLEAAPQDDILSEEVESIRFRYFANGNWFELWDSIELQALPQAVEITIGFRQTHRATSGVSSATTQPGEYRLLVPVPASEGQML